MMSDFDPLFDNYSLEATARDAVALGEFLPGLSRPSQVFVPYLHGESDTARTTACAAVSRQGLDPVPHLSARRLHSAEQLDRLLAELVSGAGVRSGFLVAGDVARPAGPFADSLQVIESGLFERHGLTRVSIAGHPDGHPHVNEEALWDAMRAKVAALAGRGLETEVVTQFSFDAAGVLGWLADLRRHGITVPVRIGIPGPAGATTLVRYAARCGVAASAGALAKYGLSLGHLIGTAGPDRFLGDLQEGLARDDLGPVYLHVFPFGGFTRLRGWMTERLKAA